MADNESEGFRTVETLVLPDIPDSVVEAAHHVETWFSTRNIKTWELMGICSRNHAFAMKTINGISSMQNTRLGSTASQHDHSPN